MTKEQPPNSLLRLGILLSGLVLAALALFILTGGDLGGTRKVESDADLPQVTSPPPRTTGESTGSR